MSEYMLLIVLLPVVLVVAIFVFVRRRMKERLEALKNVALHTGFSFEEKESGVPDPVPGSFHLFQSTGRGSSRNIMRGRMGRDEAVLFDYEYVISTGKSAQTVRQTVAAIRRSEQSLPGFELRPENVFHKIGQMVGYQDFDFPEDRDFSSAYLLRGEDEQAVTAVFPSYVREHLKQRKGWSLEGSGEWFIAYKARKTPGPDAYRSFLEEAHAIRDMLRPA